MPRRRYTVPLAGGRTLALGGRTLVMGVLNVTPDSFSDGGLFIDPQRAVDEALRMVEAGADLIDVGGESTRPGAAIVDADEERRRVVPVVEALARRVAVPLSVDTSKAEVARAALDAGAAIVNDISGLTYDPGLAAVVAATGAGLVLMHTRGRPADMYAQAAYDDVCAEVGAELRASLDRALAAGVAREAIILDPGLGFAKRAEHSLEALAGLDAEAFVALDRPWLVGPSRKSFLQAAIGETAPGDRDWATAAAVAVAIVLGAHIVRVHRVPEMVQVARVTDLLLARRPASD
jgi:dihydropteroate synthase